MDVAKSEGEAQSEEGREKLQKLVAELEESPECVGVWVSIA
jgi:transcriptional/translational regulatory protein YebC/TACO1